MMKKGFTLLESVLVAGIFAFAVCGMLLLFITNAYLDTVNRNKTIATAHAETALEYARRAGFSTVRQNLCSGSGAWAIPLADLNLSGLDGESPISITTTTADYCSAELLDLTAAVTWTEKTQTRNLSIWTQITQ